METVKILNTITLVVMPDDSPDLSYLDDDNWDDPEDKANNAERVRQLNAGLWWPVGVFAEARVDIVRRFTGDGEQLIGQIDYSSSGIWNCESDGIDTAYYVEELRELHNILESQGFTAQEIADALDPDAAYYYDPMEHAA